MPLRPLLLIACAAMPVLPAKAEVAGLTYGPRPAYLVDRMADGPLKETLAACLGQTPAATDFSIGHRGAALMFPEHTRESYVAAARMGAGILECDVTFTRDHELVCRHAQDDLATTTDILTGDLAGRCHVPFAPASGGSEAVAECRTSDLTLDEFRTLAPKMDASDRSATTPEDYQRATPSFRTDLYAGGATLMSHAESIALFAELGAGFTPELKAPVVDMPHDGFTQQDYAQKLIDEYRAAGVAPERVWPQSFDLGDVLYWIENEPEFGRQAVYLDGRWRADGFDPMVPASWPESMAELFDQGLRYIAPPLWMLLTTDGAGAIVPSAYATEARAAGLEIITWTMERGGPLGGRDWYTQTIAEAARDDGAVYEILDVLAQDVGVAGVFSDWPATVTFYANCMGL